MKLALFCLALGVLPLPGQVAAIAVYTDFRHAPSAVVLASLKHEVTSIISPLGLELEWTSLNAPHGDKVSRELAVVTFQGTCDTGGTQPRPFPSGGLGWTHISEGQIIPFMDVDCDRIRGFVRGRLSEADPAKRDGLLGRAVGRVVAHELYHILGRRAHHGSGTVDRPEYHVQDLLSDRFPLDDSECRILQLANSRALPLSVSSFDEPAGSAKMGQAKFVEKHCSVCHGSRGEGTRHGPALRAAAGRSINSVVLAAQLGIDSQAMCRRAEQLRLVVDSLRPDDIPNLLRFLNDPSY